MFYSLFAKHVAINPEKVAIVHKEQAITYGDMEKSITQAAQNLSAMGVKQSNLVVICFDDGIQYLILYYALARIGATIIPLPPNLAPNEVEMFCRECLPNYYIINQHYVDSYIKILESLRKGQLISSNTEPYNLESIFFANESQDITLPEGNWTDQDLVIHYNTPNSSDPREKFKGCVQTHKSQANRMLNWIKTAQIVSQDKTLCIHSLMHAFGSEMFAFPALSSGQTLYLMTSQDAEPDKVGSVIKDEKITLFGALPWFYKAMNELSPQLRSDISSLRIAICGATPLPIDTAENFFSIYGKKINNSYGLTETSLIAINLFKNETQDLLTVGQVIANVDAKILDCGVNIRGVGELLVRSNGFATRYYSSDLSPLCKKDNWIHTGDLVKYDEAGNLSIIGRVSQVIDTPEGKFFPLEIEKTIEQLPEIREVAVVPVYKESGTKTAAFIVRSEFISEKDIRTFVEQKLEKYKVPTYIEFRESFPKSATGKISRAKLKIES